MCPPMRAHWRHLANTIELVHPSAYLSPRPKLQTDRFSRFCTAHGTKSLYFTMGAPIHQNCPFPWRHLDPQLIHDSLGPCEPKTHSQVDRFSRFCTTDYRVSLYFTMVRPFLPQNCPFPRRIWTPCNMWFLGPT